ncbi:MAG: LPS assembly lipoprotein LptE, partial [Flavobacteriales bacterium]
MSQKLKIAKHKLQIRNTGYTILCILYFTLLSNCYSLNGSSLDPTIKTVQIDLFPNYAPLQNVTLSQTFTNDLRDRFQQRTPLDVVE